MPAQTCQFTPTAAAPAPGEMRCIPLGPGGGLLVEGGNLAAIAAAMAPSTPASSASALEASHVLKASAGTFRSLFAEIDASAPTATYYVQLLTGSATVPDDGAVAFLRPPITVVHVVGTPDYVTFDEGDSGIAFTVGCTACLSSTRFTKTIAGAYGLFAGSVL